MNSEDYFSNRTIQDEEKVRTQSLDVESEVINAYKKAQSYLTGEVKKLYRRYINKSGKTEAEVKQILNTTAEPSELVRLKGLTRDITNEDLQAEAKNYLNGLAVKSRITRLETLKAKSYIVSKQVADVQLSKSTNFYVDVIQEAHNKAAAEAIIGNTEKAYNLHNDGKYKSFTVKGGKLVVELVKEGTNEVLDTVKVKKDEPIKEFKELSTKYTKNILESHWKGSNYSKRIWNDTELLAKHLQEMFTIETMTGLSEREMVSILVKEFDTSIYAARRLIRTEANYMANQAKLKGWKEHGVEKYMIVAVLDLRTSVICQGQDGKIYDIDKAQAGFNFPPFHPFCRSVVRAYFGTQSLAAKRTAIDRVTGEPMTITQGTNYKEWEKMLLDKHGKKDVEVAKSKIINYKRDLEMYNKFKSKLGDSFTKNFDSFQEVKYTDITKWQEWLKNKKE